jgi:hypothetical protein
MNTPKFAIRAKNLMFICLLLTLFISCEIDDELTPEEQQEQEEMNDDPANSTGRFSDFLS